MSPLQTTLISSLVGAGVAGVCTLSGIFLNNLLTRTRERRQQLWRIEVDRIIDLEERAGQLVELVCGNEPNWFVSDKAQPQLEVLSKDVGRFLRHAPLATAIRDLRQFLLIAMSDKSAGGDNREIVSQVLKIHQRLLAECDTITGKRLI